jgi:hypothetical protein
MVTKETDTRPNPGQERIQACCVADIACPPAMPLETHTGWCVMRQHNIHAAGFREPFNLVYRVMSLGVTLKPIGTA